MKALVLVNGELYQPDILRRRIKAEVFDLIIGTDGGTRHARILDVVPDAIIGDMDSLSDSDRQSSGNAEFISFPVEKNETDLELALLYVLKKGANEVIMVGVMGGRMDMTVVNIMLLAHLSFSSCRIELWHGEQTGWVIKSPGGDIPGRPGDTVSLIPLNGDASSVTTTGLKYPLTNEKLLFGAPRGVSNVLDRIPANVKLSEGLLLAVHTPRPEAGKEKNIMAKKRTVNVGVQCLPLVDNVYSVVDKAIEAIKASGVKYEVGPLETTLEGDDLDKLIEVAKAAHRACFEAGAGRVVTIIKIADALEGTSIEQKVGKYRRVNA